MVGGNVNIEMFDFQERAVLSLIDLTAEGKKQILHRGLREGILGF